MERRRRPRGIPFYWQPRRLHAVPDETPAAATTPVPVAAVAPAIAPPARPEPLLKMSVVYPDGVVRDVPVAYRLVAAVPELVDGMLIHVDHFRQGRSTVAVSLGGNA